MSRNSDYTTRNLLDYLYHQKCYKRIGSALSTISPQIIFTGKFEEEKAAKSYSKFFFRFINCIRII